MSAAAIFSFLFGRDDLARAVFLAWEGLRIVYNAVTLFLTLALASAFGATSIPSFWVQAVEGAFLANFCFCAGPCAEGYLALIGADRRIARAIAFTGGLSLTSVAAFLAVFAIAFADFD